AALAKQYCGSCHQFPEPEILTKKSWDYLLTDMGFRLGIVDYSHLEDASPIAVLNMTTRERILQMGGLIPEKPLITTDDWASIKAYYSQNAPDQPLVQPKKKKIKTKLNNFILKIPDYQPKEAILTLMRIDEKNKRILMGNQSEKTLSILDQNLHRVQTYSDHELLVDIEANGDSLYLLSIGDLMGRYVGEANGYLQLTEGKSDHIRRMGKTVTGLHRPADMEFADLDGDGINELIVCNFGDVTGNVSIYEKQGQKYTLQQELHNAPGAIKSQVHDFNQDGLPDIVVLFGDARENISLFMNQGNHRYQREIIVETHSAYGHTYFELQDFDKDGHMDILAVNGDTDADPFNTLKNYHGIRIYLNDRKNNFNLEYFYPMYGAHFAKAADFDKDGDLDIAASAFFPDFALDRPEQFTYLENKGNLNFASYTHPETFDGRWMTMDIGDYDQDGDVDIALGAGYLPLGMAVKYREKLRSLRANGKAILVFENTINK
ncbi:MAG: FG-GAP repeat domain-containing protein, partial [Cyclobacteriaceae bacterium]